MLKESTHLKFAVGQQWKYFSRSESPDSTLIVLKIEAHPQFGTIVHVSVSDDVIPVFSSESYGESDIGHLPIDSEVLEKSVTELVKEDVFLPDFEDGYQSWRHAFEHGCAGVYSCPLSECIRFGDDLGRD